MVGTINFFRLILLAAFCSMTAYGYWTHEQEQESTSWSCPSWGRCARLEQCRVELKRAQHKRGYTFSSEGITRKLLRTRCYGGQGVCCPVTGAAQQSKGNPWSRPEKSSKMISTDWNFPKIPIEESEPPLAEVTALPTVKPAPTTLPATTAPPTSAATPRPPLTITGIDPALQKHPNFRVLAGPHCGFGLPIRISRGLDVTPGELPWIVMLQYREKGRLVFRCGGALISSRYVLTAAHCIPAPSDKKMQLVSVRLGETNLASRVDCGEMDMAYDEVDVAKGDVVKSNRTPGSMVTVERCSGPPQNLKIEKAFVHPGFSFKDALKGYPNDIGLIRLRENAETSAFVQPICLLGLANPAVRGQLGMRLQNFSVAGWGMTDMKMSPQSDELQRANVSVVPQDTCNKIWKRKIDTCQLCAGGSAGNACRGDSGGPLMAQASDGNNMTCHLLVGVVSHGTFGCGTTTIPTVFSDVMCFLPWLLDTVVR